MKLTNELLLEINIRNHTANKITSKGIRDVAEREGFLIEGVPGWYEFYRHDPESGDYMSFRIPIEPKMDWFAFVGIAIKNICFETGHTELRVLVDLLRASGEEVEL